VASIARDSDAGMVVIRHAGRSLLQSIFGGNLVQMAAELPCPLLLAKRSNPYKRLLVPFNGSLAGQRALEIAMDLSRHLDAEVSAVVVVEPSYLRGAESSTGQWENRMLKQVRELAHVHKIKVDEQVRHGNPVKEILSIADDYQLLVIGGDEDKAGLFSLDVAGVLADRARCSVLLVS
jgi:nucleotide-binding universal stress UspA family protein